MSESLASLSLFAATWEQTVESRKRTYPQWGRGLTEEQYRARDGQMDPMEHAAEGKLATWCVSFNCAFLIVHELFQGYSLLEIIRHLWTSNAPARREIVISLRSTIRSYDS